MAHSRLLEVVHFAIQDREHDRQRNQPPTASPKAATPSALSDEGVVNCE